MNARPLAPVAIVFDLDDTLFVERDFVLSGFKAAARIAGSERGLADFERVCGKLFAAGHRGDVFDRALIALGIEADPAIVQNLVTAYRAHVPQLTLLPDALSALVRLADAYVPVGLITDGPHAVQERKIEALRLVGLVQEIVCTDALGGRDFWKPNPLAFELMMQRLPAADYVYVGDNPAKDFVAPNALGWLSVQVLRPDGDYAGRTTPAGGSADAQITSLLDLEAVVRARLKRREQLQSRSAL